MLTQCFTAQAQVFAPPSTSPYVQTANYTGFSNGSLPVEPVTKGLVFDRFIQVCSYSIPSHARSEQLADYALDLV
jgi:hypothetical protein